MTSSLDAGIAKALSSKLTSAIASMDDAVGKRSAGHVRKGWEDLTVGIAAQAPVT